MKLFIVDDHKVFCDCLESYLDRQNAYEVVGKASWVKDTLPAVLDTDPEMAILDYQLPDGNGFELAESLLKHKPDLKIIIMSMLLYPAMIKRGQSLGIKGFVSKKSELVKLVDALKALECGETYIDSELNIDGPKTKTKEKLKNLTDREFQIMAMLARGMSNKAIAEELEISIKTVEYHRGNIMDKLDITTLVSLSQYAPKKCDSFIFGTR